MQFIINNRSDYLMVLVLFIYLSIYLICNYFLVVNVRVVNVHCC